MLDTTQPVKPPKLPAPPGGTQSGFTPGLDEHLKPLVDGPRLNTPGGGLEGTMPVPPAPAAPGGGLETTQPVPPTPAAPGGGLETNQPIRPPGYTPPPTQGPGMDPNAALNQVQQAAQGKLGRVLTPQELQVLYQQVQYTGGPVSAEQLQNALGMVGKYSGNLQDPWGAGAAPGGTAPTPTAPSPAAATHTAAQEALRQLLLTGSTPALSNVDPNNPAMQAQRQAFERSNTQNITRERLAAAERSAARGTSGAGGFDAELAGIEQGAGDRSVAFDADLMKNELEGQRSRVMQAMQLAVQSGDQEMQRQLQEKLGLIDADIRKQGLTLQGSLGKGQLGLGYLQTMLGNQQAGNQLGYNYTALQQQANQQAMQQLLAGFGGG